MTSLINAAKLNEYFGGTLNLKHDRPPIPIYEKLAVFFDMENISSGFDLNKGIEPVIDYFKYYGKVLLAKAYGDWDVLKSFKHEFQNLGIQMCEFPKKRGSDETAKYKNGADIQITIDILELALVNPNIDTFVISSGDTDFLPLIVKLRELNKRVILLGIPEITGKKLIKNVDEVIFFNQCYEELFEGKVHSNFISFGQNCEVKEIKNPIHADYETVLKALKKLKENDHNSINEGTLKSVCMEFDSTINTRYHKRGLSKLTEEMMEKQLIEVELKKGHRYISIK
jgi:uncharacterized LabA/DUF88 family protein